MASRKFGKVKTKAILKLLDQTARKYGLDEVRHATTKWCTGQRDRLRLARQRRAIEKQLAELNSRLK